MRIFPGLRLCSRSASSPPASCPESLATRNTSTCLGEASGAGTAGGAGADTGQERRFLVEREPERSQEELDFADTRLLREQVHQAGRILEVPRQAASVWGRDDPLGLRTEDIQADKLQDRGVCERREAAGNFNNAGY